MIIAKKLLFAPLFLIVFVILLSQLSLIFKSYDLIFSLSLQTFMQLIIISILITLASFSFILFATLCLDWKLILPTAALASLIPMLFFEPSLGLIFSVGSLVTMILVFAGLENTMKSYLTFKPFSLLGPSIRLLSTFLILVISITYFLSVNKIVSEKGFQIPDSLIDTALNLTNQTGSNKQETQSPLPSLTQEQIDLLKKNPDLLRQSGLDPKILDTLNSPKSQNPTNDLIKQTVKDQLQNFLKPYLGFIPALLAVLLFLTLQSLTSIINLLIYPLLWITFYILEKTGFIKFTTEMRPVKKMIV